LLMRVAHCNSWKLSKSTCRMFHKKNSIPTFN
jgi:hypothetical protein